jgi:uncharacterized protein YozE (UPF0346 family)
VSTYDERSSTIECADHPPLKAGMFKIISQHLEDQTFHNFIITNFNELAQLYIKRMPALVTFTVSTIYVIAG